MARTKISEFSATPANNTDIDSINIAEGCAPSGINDAIRELMAQLKDFQTGAVGDSFNGPINGTVGATTPAAGAFTTLSASSTLGVTGVSTLTGGAVVEGMTVGKGAGAVATNTAVGASALAANQAGGTNNTAIGNAALDANTTGDANTAVGNDALGANTTANNNTAVGYQAGYTNITGANNIALGYRASYLSTAANSVVALGAYSLYNNTATDIVAVGVEAAYSNTTGTNNVAMGNASLYANTTGSSNTALGMLALRFNTTASENTAVGYQALYTNTTGAVNVAIGKNALQSSNSSYNTAVGGGGALYSATSGAYNTAIGFGSGYNITTGSKNTILGSYNGNQGGLDIRTATGYIVLSDGDGNPAAYSAYSGNATTWFINAQSGFRYSGLQFNIAGTYKSQMYYDNTATNLYVQNASAGVYLAANATSWTSASDERLKENLIPISDGLAKVCSLRSVIGNFIADTSKKQTPFLIAQDVQAVLPEAVSTTTEKNSDTEYLGVAYTEVIPLLVAAIKELKAEIDILKGQA